MCYLISWTSCAFVFFNGGCSIKQAHGVFFSLLICCNYNSRLVLLCFFQGCSYFFKILPIWTSGFKRKASNFGA